MIVGEDAVAVEVDGVAGGEEAACAGEDVEVVDDILVFGVNAVVVEVDVGTEAFAAVGDGVVVGVEADVEAEFAGVGEAVVVAVGRAGDEAVGLDLVDGAALVEADEVELAARVFAVECEALPEAIARFGPELAASARSGGEP